MQSVTLVVKMTGLLLLTPHSQAGNGRPTHVLMPTTPVEDVPRHVAQIGYRRSQGPSCQKPVDGICYEDLKGRSLDISGPSNPLDSPSFPPGNVSSVPAWRVPPHYFGQAPGPTVTSRVTLTHGVSANPCALGTWTFQNTRTPLTNVLSWTVENFGQDRIFLLLKPLAGSGHTGPKTIGPIRASNKMIELFIRHVPEDEQDHHFLSRRGRRGMQVSKDAMRPVEPGAKATHFHAYYAMLNIPRDQRPPVPELEHTNGHPKYCPWVAAPRDTAVIDRFRSPGTATCMVASGIPRQ